MSINDVMVQWADDFVAQNGCEEILSTASIKDEVMKMGVNRSSIIPSDHCYNRANKDVTSFGSKTALFLYIEPNKYQCVGSRYGYNGRIFCRPKGDSEDLDWGCFDSKARKKIPWSETNQLQEGHANRKTFRNQTRAYKKTPNDSQSKAVAENHLLPNARLRPTKPLDFRFLDTIERYLYENKILYDSPIVKWVEERRNGRRFALNDHLRGYVHAQMSNSRTWSYLEPHLPEIDEIFCNYDVKAIINKLDSVGHDYFISRVKAIKCGNRGINQQMQALRENINVFNRLIDEHGSLDEFVTSQPFIEIIGMLSDPGSHYKLRSLGKRLTAEYLRNVGIDCPKPDLHMCRLFGGKRLGISSKDEASYSEVFQAIAEMSEKTGYSQARIDNILWSYCAKGYGEVCSSEAKCKECVIQDYCKKGEK